MEAVPRLPMLSFELKHSPEYIEFGPSLKQYIRDHYGEDPALYNKPCTDLEQLRQGAIHVTRDFMGCSTLKKYYAQLQFLQGRFPMGEGGEAAIAFTWEDIQTGREYILGDIKFEQACILYNIGALHSILGAMDTRNSAEGMKVSCTHFQCAAWAFEHLRDHFGSSAMSTDMSHELLTFHVSLMLAQGQECILEKSMIDSRKNTITAKVAAQVVEFYRTAIKNLETCNQEGIVSSRCYKDWKKRMELKTCFYQCITHYYMGRQAEEQQKMGERLAYFQAGQDKLNESVKLAKNEVPEIQDALKFAQDVVGGKFNSAKKDNDFVYHEKVPGIETLPEVKGASLVKGIPFNPTDPEISGHDIFQKLVPMEAHEASSVYSEEKAKLLRGVSGEVEEKSMELEQYMSSLQLDPNKLLPRMEPLPQELLEKCAAMSVKTEVIQNLIESMAAVAGRATEVELNLKETGAFLEEEKKQEEEFQKKFGARAPNIVLSEIRKDMELQRDKHKQGNQSNENLHKAMNVHIANLRLLAGAPDELQATLPEQELTNSPEDEAIVQELQRLLSKVDMMRKQRTTLTDELRTQIQNDDITNVLVTQDTGNKDSIYNEQLKKHDKQIQLIRQNLLAQENILRALTDTNARYATIRRATSESIARRNARISELIKSYEVYEDLMGKSQKGLDYYKKLEETVTRILQRCRSVCKVQQEERDQITKRFAPKEPAPSRPAAPKPVPGQSPSPIHGAAQIPGEASLPTFEGPKLKDYLPFMKPATFGPKADRTHPESPDPMQGGSLPASVTGSPVHHSPGRGSPRSSPARQLPAAGIDYSGLPPELTAQLAKLPAGFFNKLKDGAPAPSPVAPDLTDGLQHRHTPPVPDTGIDPNLPAEIQAQLAKLPKGFFSQLKNNPGQGLGDQPSSLPHISSAGFHPGGSNLGQNEYGSMPNMSQLPQQARKYDSTSTVSSVETPVISPTKGPQGDRTGHFHSYHGGQTVNYQGQDLPKGQHHQQQLPNHYQNPNLYSSGQAGPVIPPQNTGYSTGPNQMPNQVTTQHAPMTSQASLSQTQLPQHQPIPPAQHLAQQPNELQRPSPASTPQSSHYPASSQNPNLQSQYQYQQMPQTSLQSQYHSGNLPQQTQQPAHQQQQQQQQQQHQQQQYQQTHQQPQQYQQPLPQQPQQQQQHSLQNQQQFQTQQVQQPSSQFYQTSGQGIAGQNMSTGTKSQATSVPSTGYTQHAPASQYGMTPQGQVAPQAYPNQHVQGAPRFQTPVHQPQTQHSQAQQPQIQQPQVQQPQVQQPQSNIGYSQQSTTQFSGSQHQRPHQANVQSWQNPTSQVPSSQNQASVAYTGQTQQFLNQQQNQFSQPGYVQPQSVQQPIAQSSQSYVQPSVSSSQTFYSQQTSTTYNQTFQNQAVSQTQAYNQQNKMTQQYQTPAQNQSMGSQGLPQSNYQVGHTGQTTVQSQNYQLHTGNQQQISGQQQVGQQQVGQQHVSQQHLAQVGQQQIRQQQVGQQISQQQVGQQQGRQQEIGQQQVGQQQPGFQKPHATTGQYQYNQQQQGQAQVQSWQQVPQANQAAYTSQQQPRHSQSTQGYSQQATPNLGYSQQGQTPQNFNQQMRPTGPSQAQQMQYQPVLQPTQASQPLPTQMTPSSQQTPLSPIVSSQPPLPQPTHPVQPAQVAPQGPSQGVPQTVPSLHPASQRSVPGSNLSRQSSSLDEILSSSPEGTKDSTIPAPMIAPKVLTAQEIQHQKEEALKNKGIFDPPKEPYAPGCELNKFVSDVEDFGKLVDELTVANVMGQTKLDALWKDLQENQEHESKRHSIAIARCYPMKNRDPDIMPYDETRVMLSTMKDDYINASWINDLAPSCPKFITTQSPIPVTVNDFWVMVYEQGVEVIVMITSEYETGKKFPCYWPTEKGKQIEHGPVILNLQSVKYKEFWTERIIHLKHSETKVGRTVVHLQYKNWPVSGFPDNVSHVVKFITEVHNFYRQQRSLMKPVLVHCGNGIGRSGSFLLTYTGMQEILQGNGLVQVPVMARRLLNKRKNILQNKEQIKFSFDSILFFAEDFLKKKDVLVKKPHYMERKKSSDSHAHLPAKDDIVLGTVNLEIIKQNVGKFGEKHGDSHNTSSNGDMQQGQTTLDTMTIPREDNSLSTLPDLIQQPSRTENLGQVSGLNPSQNAPASHSDVSSGLGSPQVRSRSGSNSSILSGSSISGTSLKGSPQHKADGQSMPSSLADLQNPNTFTLGTSAPEKKKISKSNFSSKSTGIKENLNKPDDPLSSLDPLWTIAKEK